MPSPVCGSWEDCLSHMCQQIMYLCCKNVIDKHNIILRYFSVTFSLPYTLHAIEDLNDEQIDGVILVASSVEYLDGPLEPLKNAVEAYIKVSHHQSTLFAVSPNSHFPYPYIA